MSGPIELTLVVDLLFRAFVSQVSQHSLSLAFQSMKPIVSSMIAAKVLVSRCFPLVIGGNCAILTRKPSDFCIAGVRFLRSVSATHSAKVEYALNVSS
jgi:hypothetical protein